MNVTDETSAPRTRLPRRLTIALAGFLVVAVLTEILLLQNFLRLQQAAQGYNSGTQVITILADVQRETLKLRESVLVDRSLDTQYVQLRRDLLANQLRILREATDELVFLGVETPGEIAGFHQALARFDGLRARPATATGTAEALAELAALDLAVKATSSHEEVEFVGKLRRVESQTDALRNLLLGLTVLTLLLGIALAYAVSERYRRLYTGAYRRLEDEIAVRRRRESQLEHQAEQLVQYAAEMEAANEALRMADATKNDFVSTVSHELRTPLTAIRGFAQTLLMRWDRLDDEQRQTLIATIDRQGGRQQRLIEDLLTVSRMRAGSLVAHAETFDVREVVESCVSVVGRDGVDVRVPHGATAHADPDHVAQVLCNLLTNAKKYGAAPFVITATLDQDQLRLAVRDHGPGVPAAFVGRLFDRFEQASTGDQRTSAGLGLGLAISRELCELNGGDLVHVPTSGAGAKFVMALPATGPTMTDGDEITEIIELAEH